MSKFLLELKSKENLTVRHTTAVGYEKRLWNKPFREDLGGCPWENGWEMKKKEELCEKRRHAGFPSYLIEKEKKVFLSALGYAWVERRTREVIGAAKIITLVLKSVTCC